MDQAPMLRGLTEDQEALMTHISRWGSQGYPIQQLGRGRWTWGYRSVKGAMVFKTKKEAVASFEAFYSFLLDAKAGRI